MNRYDAEESLMREQIEKQIEKLKAEASEPVPVDLWLHRSDGMKCKTCIWFVPKPSCRTSSFHDVGRCRRHAPTMSGYPAVFVNDWCGDHKLDETKL